MKKLVSILALAAGMALAQNVEPLPSEYGAAGIVTHFGSSPVAQGQVEYGKLLSNSSTYGTLGVNIVPVNSTGLSISAVQAGFRTVVYRNRLFSVVTDGKGGVAVGGSGAVGAAYTGQAGVVFGIKPLLGYQTKLYVGVTAFDTSLSQSQVSPAIALVFTK